MVAYTSSRLVGPAAMWCTHAKRGHAFASFADLKAALAEVFTDVQAQSKARRELGNLQQGTGSVSTLYQRFLPLMRVAGYEDSQDTHFMLEMFVAACNEDVRFEVRKMIEPPATLHELG